MKNIIISVFVLNFFIINGQENQGQKFFCKDNIGIDYFDVNDTFPQILRIKGRIIDVTTGTSCGIFISSGTLMIKIDHCNLDYPDSIVFVVVGCLTRKDELINKKVTLHINALFKENKECYKPIFNCFNSNGMPFYWLTPKERAKFFKKMNRYFIIE